MTNEVPSVSRPVRRRLRKGVLPPGKISIARALSKKARNQHSTPKKVVKKKQSVVKRISASLFTLNEEGSRVYFLSDDEALSNRDARRNQKKKFGTYSDPTQQTGTLEYVGVFFFDYYRDQNEHPVFGETHGMYNSTFIPCNCVVHL